MKNNSGELIFFWLLFFVAAALSYSIARPFFVPVLLAVVAAIVFAPLQELFLRFTKKKNTLSAMLTSTTVCGAILIPLFYVASAFLQELTSLSTSFTSKGDVYTFIDTLGQRAELLVRYIAPQFALREQLSLSIENGLSFASAHFSEVLSSVMSFGLDTFVFIVALFYFTRDGKKYYQRMLVWSPLKQTHSTQICSLLVGAVNSIVKGAMFSALMQGMLVALGFAFLGIREPLFWGFIACISAFVPPLGSALVIIPTSLYMFFTGNMLAGLGLVILGIAIGLVDNIIKPLVIRSGVAVHPFIILLSIIGGIAYTGPFGFITGPIIIAGFFVLLSLAPQIVGSTVAKEQ